MFRSLNPLLLLANVLGGCAIMPLFIHFFAMEATGPQRGAVLVLATAFLCAAIGGWQEHMAARRLTFEAWKNTLPVVHLTEDEAARLGLKKEKDET